MEHSKNTVIKECLICKRRFKIEFARHLSGKGKYCSKKCYSESMRKKFRDSRIIINRRYRKKNPEKCKIWKQNRRVKILNYGGSFTEKEWRELCKRFNNKCAICNKVKKLTIDHKIPVSKWRKYTSRHDIDYKYGDIQNIQPLCRGCNSRKSNKEKIESELI